MPSLRHDKSTDFCAGRPCYDHNSALIFHPCCSHLPLPCVFPFPPVPLISEKLCRHLGLPSELAVWQLWEYPRSAFYFSLSSPGILEKMELSDVSFTGELCPVLPIEAWESFRSVRWLSEMPSSEEEAMLAAFTSEISLDVSIWPKPLIFGRLFSLHWCFSFTVWTHCYYKQVWSSKQKLT